MIKSTKSNTYDGSWLQELLDTNPGKKKKQLAMYLVKRLGITESHAPGMITRVLQNKRTIKANEVEAILEFFNKSQQLPSNVSTPSKTVRIPVYDLSASAGAGSILPLEQGADAYWDLPPALLPFPVTGKNLAVLSVRGDSMSPELNDGDRVIVDMNDKHPNPSGIFVLDDGMGGVVVKRLELLFHMSPPLVRMISTNPLHTPYEVDLEQITISGRVVVKIGKV